MDHRVTIKFCFAVTETFTCLNITKRLLLTNYCSGSTKAQPLCGLYAICLDRAAEKYNVSLPIKI